MNNNGSETLKIGSNHCYLSNLFIWDHKNSILNTWTNYSHFERKRNIYSITWSYKIITLTTKKLQYL